MGTGQAAPSIEVARGQGLRSSLKGPSSPKFAPVTWQRSDVPFDPFRRDARHSCESTKQPFLLRTKRKALATLNVRKIIEANTIYNNWRINDRSLD
jgi:hypothetical protein